MSGTFFVVTIPTENEEKQLLHNSKKLRFKIPQDRCNFDSNESKTPKLVKSNDFHADDADHKYGTSNKDDQSMLQTSFGGFNECISSPQRMGNSKTKIKSNLALPIDSSMEQVLRAILKAVEIENAVWSKSQNEVAYQITFTLGYDDKRYEDVLQHLFEWGIGDRTGSSVSTLPCTVYTSAKKTNIDENDNEDAAKESAWNRFMSSIRARLNVAQIVEQVKLDATITFDFVMLVIIAAILAAFGLVEDSTIFLASSMLISPLMGPVIAAIFGAVIKDRNLQWLGMVNELFGIFLATVVGFIFGLIVCSVDDKYGIGEGLTNEMLSRCELHSLLVGVLTAIPSGAAVAIAILGENIGSLVGVAISASLLPPAVNSGLLWALACIYLMFETDGTRYNFVTKTNIYSTNQATELGILGAISMCVTITNIISIYVMGILVLKIKEVAPIVSPTYRQFWKHDIKIVRDYNKTLHSEEDGTKKLVQDLSQIPEQDIEALGRSLNSDRFRSANLDRTAYQNTWSPMGVRQYKNLNESRPSVYELERLYMTITRPYPEVGKLPRGSISGFSKAFMGRSPPRIKVLNEEAPPSLLCRRASMPFEIFRSPRHFRNFPSTSIKIEPLEKITEATASKAESSILKNTKPKKFIVTKTTDNMHQPSNE